MKKHILLLFLFIISEQASAQMRKEIFCIGPMGIVKSTWLMNKNVTNLPEGQQELELTFGSSFGLSITSYFSQNVGVGLDILYGTHNQKYNGNIDPITKTNYTSKTHITMVDLPLYLRLSTNYGAYFEIGSVFSFVTSAKYVMETNFNHHSGTKDVKPVTSGFNIAPMVGLGIDIDITNRLILSPGFRFSYGITDIKGVDGKCENTASYSSYAKTHTMSGGMLVAIVYRIEK